MGILLTLPGLMATLLLAPWVMRIFYSAEFMPAAELIRWQILGMGLRVACWPLGYISLAKGMGKTLVVIEAVSSLVEVVIIYFCIHLWGLEGCGIGYAIFMLLATVNMSIVSYKITGFKWSERSAAVLLTSIGFTGTLLLAIRYAPENLGFIVGALLTAAASAWSISSLNRALGTDLFSILRVRYLSRPKAVVPE